MVNQIIVNKLTNTINSINTHSNTSLNTNKINQINNKINDINQKNNTTIPTIQRNIHLNAANLLKPIGILDPEGLQPNPLTKEPYQNIYAESDGKTYKDFAREWSQLPMYSKANETINAIYNNQVVLVISGTGSGKTVLTPKFALHALNYNARIAITNPKRIPTEGNAAWAAKHLDVKLGKEVGIKYRDSKAQYYSKEYSKLVYCTDGYILAKLVSDPMLSDYDMVIIDEAHERGIQIDMLLLFLKHLIKRRPEFKLIIMSATINQDIFINYFPLDEYKFQTIDAGEKPNYLIKEIFLEKPINKFDELGNLINKDVFVIAMVDIIIKILKENEKGDVLAFVTGRAEAGEVMNKLHQKIAEYNKNADKKLFVVVLSGKVSDENKNYATKSDLYKSHPKGPFERKVIVATEVAESSMTFTGLDFVVDSGLVNTSKFYSDKNMNALERKYISKASHKQRRGRTGRQAPGTCYNVFTKQEYEKLFLDYPISPIKLDDISPDILAFLSRTDLVSHIDMPFRIKTNKKINNTGNNKYPTSLANFMSELIEMPHENYVNNALARLHVLGAIRVEKDKAYITDLGKAMAAFTGVKPEVAKMIISGYNYKCSDEICTYAAILEESENRIDNIFMRFDAPRGDKAAITKAKKQFDTHRDKWARVEGDPMSILDAYYVFETLRYDVKDRRTGEIIKEKKGGAKEWCKEQSIDYRVFDNVRDTAKDFSRKLFGIARGGGGEIIFADSYPNLQLARKQTTYNNGSIKEVLDTETNIMSAILEGFYINIIKNRFKTRYATCFTKESSEAQLSRESLFGRIKKKTSYAFYTEYKSIFGNASFEIVGRISPTYIKQYMNDPIKMNVIQKCIKLPETQRPARQDKGKQGKRESGRGKRKR